MRVFTTKRMDGYVTAVKSTIDHFERERNKVLSFTSYSEQIVMW